MTIHDNIRLVREVKQLSQEEMAEKLSMSVSGYAKIERGETNLKFEKLEKIAQIFQIDIIELINAGSKGVVFFVNDNKDSDHTIFGNYYGENSHLTNQIERLQLSLSHQKEIILQKDKEIEALKEIIRLLKTQN